jgi:uncharacterized membrane protein
MIKENKNLFVASAIGCTVTTNPLPLIGWGITIVVPLILSTVPFFGLLITLPVLGHALAPRRSSAMSAV